MATSDSTSPTLLLRLRDRSDSLGWREFHERYGQLLYRYARARGASDADAEDIVQEVEMYFFRAAPAFEYDATRGRFRAYLRSAVLHAMGRRADRQARQPAALDPENFNHIASQREATADDYWEREWRLHQLRWAMRTIGSEFEPITIRAFELHVLAGRDADAVAAELSLGKGSVYQAKCRVLRRLKEYLASQDPDGDI